MMRSLTVVSLLVLLAGLLSWISVVEAFKSGDKVTLLPGLNVRNGPCGQALYTTTNSVSGTVTGVRGASGCTLGKFTWLSVKLSSGGTVWAAQETGLVIGGGDSGHNKNVPYVHQLWDTGNVFDGRYACGPVSAVMAVAYFGRLPKKPLPNAAPYQHYNDYGHYVSNVYTSPYTGFTFNQKMPDPLGRYYGGAYGTCTDGEQGWAWRIRDYVQQNGLKAEFFPTADYQSIRNSIRRGRLVILSTMIGGGHIIVVRGYDDATGRLIVNDPWGDYNKSGYGRQINGANVKYTFAQMRVKWRVEVWT